MTTTATTIVVRNGMTALEAAIACRSSRLYPDEAIGSLFTLDPAWGWTVEMVSERLPAAKAMIDAGYPLAV